ncbi:MAG: alpha-galactosidase [Firmicutes bacterium]|nr:alpha-galactosidase [Bacillota bacterium]
MSEVFSAAQISYVKWDCNRNFSDVYSPYLPPERQGETAHRYMLGLYRVMRELTERFPDILFEGCAATGYDERVRFFPDFFSRLYFMEAVE